MLTIFDTTAGYPARCVGRHPDESADPAVLTSNPNAVGVIDPDTDHHNHRYLALDGPLPGGQVIYNDVDEQDDTARMNLGTQGVLSLTVIAGVLAYVVRTRMPDLSPVETAALDLVVGALPDVATLRALLERGGLGKDLAKAKAVLEDLAGS